MNDVCHLCNTRDFRLPLRCKWDLCSFGDFTQRGMVLTDVSGQPVGHVFKVPLKVGPIWSPET